VNTLRSPVLALAGVGLARALLAVPRDRLPGGGASWIRLNYRGRPVSLHAGPVVALAGAVSAAAGAPSAGLRRSVALAGLAAGAVGGYDDCRPDPAPDKGFRGHLRALADGRVTSGVAKVAGIGAAGVVAAGPVARGPVDRLVAGGIVAGTANLLNLLDLRPGRALKAALLIGAPLLRGRNGAMVAGPLGVAVALLGDDLGERTMLGDAGANAVGAILGVRLAAGVSGRRRWALLAGLAGLTALSEVASFSRVIRATPGLRELDALGRRPDGPSR
jgi:hypothetical protein